LEAFTVLDVKDAAVGQPVRAPALLSAPDKFCESNI